MIRNFFFLVSFLYSVIFYSQNYRAIDTADTTKRKAFLVKNEAISSAYSDLLRAKFPGNTGREILSNYKDYNKEFIQQVKSRDYTFHSDFENYLNIVVQEISKNNPNVPKDLMILIAKDNSPNAICVGDGTFIVNMGLFNWLDNEDQLVAVLGHEIAHKLKSHSLKWQEKVLEINKSNADKVKQIKYSVDNKKSRAFDLYKSSLYRGSVEKRKHEEEADSLGYVLFKKTKYENVEFVNALRNLRKYDTIARQVVGKEVYRKVFNLPNAPFKEKWLKIEDFSQYKYNLYKEKIDKDSLSTHPEITNRIDRLQSRFPELKVESRKGIDEFNINFANLKRIAKMEIIPNYYQSEEYGLGIYTALQELENGVETEFYKDWMGKCFQKIVEGRKNYNLNRYLDRVDPKNQSESYQQFLNFMWNLSLDDLEKIANYYKKDS